MSHSETQNTTFNRSRIKKLNNKGCKFERSTETNQKRTQFQ